jgi:hypothetical protein
LPGSCFGATSRTSCCRARPACSSRKSDERAQERRPGASWPLCATYSS